MPFLYCPDGGEWCKRPNNNENWPAVASRVGDEGNATAAAGWMYSVVQIKASYKAPMFCRMNGHKKSRFLWRLLIRGNIM